MNKVSSPLKIDVNRTRTLFVGQQQDKHDWPKSSTPRVEHHISIRSIVPLSEQHILPTVPPLAYRAEIPAL
jgi:hypothetical protein